MINLVVGSKEGRLKLKGSDLTRLGLREEKKKRGLEDGISLPNSQLKENIPKIMQRDYLC